MKLYNQFVPTLLKGPVELYYKGVNLKSNSDLEIKVTYYTQYVGRTLQGFDYEENMGLHVQVSFTPLMDFSPQLIKILYPHLNLVSGDSLLADTNNTLVIYAQGTQIFEIHEATIIQMPSIRLGSLQNCLGKVTFVGTWLPQTSEWLLEPSENETTLWTNSIPIPVLCEWGSQAPWNHFYPSQGATIIFKTNYTQTLSECYQLPRNMLFKHLETKVQLHLEHFPNDWTLAEKIEDLNLTAEMEDWALVFNAKNMGLATTPHIKLGIRDKKPQKLVLKNTQQSRTHHRPLYSIYLKQ